MKESLFGIVFLAYAVAFYLIGIRVERALRKKYPEWKLFGGGNPRERWHETKIGSRANLIIWASFFAGWISVYAACEWIF